jgi:hypothetical protein
MYTYCPPLGTVRVFPKDEQVSVVTTGDTHL